MLFFIMMMIMIFLLTKILVNYFYSSLSLLFRIV